ncbi:hypothetical protein K1719_032745 [Acacia pycnantha]|nr:hypothetical protein K1719_032745 [Acacia pycnantha]
MEALFVCSSGRSIPPLLHCRVSDLFLLRQLHRWKLRLEKMQLSVYGILRSSKPHQARYMVDLEVHLPTHFDPFAESKESDTPNAKGDMMSNNNVGGIIPYQQQLQVETTALLLGAIHKEFIGDYNIIETREK